MRVNTCLRLPLPHSAHQLVVRDLHAFIGISQALSGALDEYSHFAGASISQFLSPYIEGPGGVFESQLSTGASRT